MKVNFTKLSGLMIALLLITNIGWSQIQTPLDNALRHVEQNFEQLDLTETDVSDMGISAQYKTDHNGVTHIYFIQRHQGIEVYNAIMNVNILPDSEILSIGNRFIPNLSTKVNTTFPGITAADAVIVAAQYLELTMEDSPRMLEQKNEQAFIFGKDDISNEDIPVQLRFQALNDGTVRLAWDLAIDVKNHSDYWSMRVDAFNGEILNKNNYTVYCKFEEGYGHRHDESCKDDNVISVNEALVSQNKMVTDGAQYRVFAWPAESPAHGDHIIVESPSNPIASPYGWHDTNGQDGAEYTITRGNNAHAYLDWNGTNSPTSPEPNGGADLIFDFLHDDDFEPIDQPDAATVNLFYVNNMVHDFTYNYGFNEAAGNFQENNYGNGGSASDYVRAEAQDNLNDETVVNNANFSTPPDGGNPRMQMFVWNRDRASRVLRVDEPMSLSGTYNSSPASGWGAEITSDNPVTGEVVIVDDGVANQLTSDACEPIINGSEIEGKIALIERGTCEFGFKALAAEEEGAIGVIICNYLDALVTMGDGAVGGQVTIPVLSTTRTVCDQIIQNVGSGVVVTIVAATETGPDFLDGDFDNGIIAHEYGHGISNRLTGGPQQAGCFSNGIVDGTTGDIIQDGEQMGEGISDFFALVTTVKLGDNGEMPRGVGTYITREDNDGRGIRTYPYSTDLVVNPHSYGDLPNSGIPHGIGSVWCAMLWEVYWAFVDQYGWSGDITDMSAGNNLAIQLIVDGMKMQPCNPGFVDARDAILDSDVAMTGGENACLIWEAFAKRGLGYSADQGSPWVSADGLEAFDPHPHCVLELKIAKEVTDLIDAGDDIDVTLTVNNHKDATLTNVIVTDEIPSGTSFINGSSSIPGVVNGNVITFELGDMSYLDEIIISYKLSTPENDYSIQQFLDDVPDAGADDYWGAYPIEGDFFDNIWQISDIFANSGNFAWSVEDIATESQQALELIDPVLVEGTQPVLRFYHLYNTEVGFDGGFIDVSIDNGDTWFQVGDKIFKNGYERFLSYSSLAIPNLEAWSGNSGGFIPTYVDLSEYIGEELKVRFRFGTDDNSGGLGWFVDDIEFMDMVNYNGEACVISDQGDMACDIADSRGTIVESDLESSIIDPESNVHVAIYPNPAQEYINVTISAPQQQEVNISLMTVDGKEVLAQKVQAIGTQTLPIAVSDLPSGFYFVKVSTEGGMITEKVVVH